jgi:hypothetical protein
MMRIRLNWLSNTYFWSAASIWACALGARAKSPGVGDALANGLVWGQATNQLWSGVAWETRQVDQGFLQDVRIFIQSTITNGILGYLLPPDHKLAKVELRDSHGAVLRPLNGKDFTGQLAETIAEHDLPRRGFSRSTLKVPRDSLHLAPNIPEVFWSFNLQDNYRIETEGDYTLTVIVGLYHFSSDGTDVRRMDLPPVTVKMHLTASPPKSGEAWGPISNHFAAGLFCESVDRSQRPFQELKIAVKTTKTNDLWGYLMPPSHKLAKVELRDAAGTLLTPLKGKKLDGDLPHQIWANTLPRDSLIRHTASGSVGPLELLHNLPVCPWDVSIQDTYRIEKEGDYTLSVTVAIYHFTSDEQTVVRMDLPPVTALVHLTPSQK